MAMAIAVIALATNAVIERKGARTALLTTQGFRDVIAWAMKVVTISTDLNIVLPEPLVPRHLRLPVPERLDNEGNILLPLDAAACVRWCRSCNGSTSKALRSVCCMLLSTRRMSSACARLSPTHCPNVPVSLSSEVSPEMREWERFSTTVANAYVQPLMARYLRRLADGQHTRTRHHTTTYC